ncbi:MAG: DUF4194 domain-containing protein [Verrucomicrobia bacterium]|nr:DUF4194 domain-containing protein [Verrucomicrobiota bacterium]
MPLPWPTFTTWSRIAEGDRLALSDVLAELLAHGALLGEQGRERELYLLAREYQVELTEYLAPLHLLLVSDPDRPIFFLRPMPADCGLTARFNKAETLLLLTLWRMYHDARLELAAPAVLVTANDIWQRLKVYFEHIEPPTAAHLREMLSKFRFRRLVRVQWNEEAGYFGDTQVEILPTLAHTIPFQDLTAWEQHTATFLPPAPVAAEAGAETAKEALA